MKETIYKHPLGFSLVWTLVILCVCATPGQYIPNLGWLELLSFDKFVHATMFFILCSLLFTIAVKHAQAPWFKYIYALGAAAYGVLLEVMQARYFSHRSYDVLDIAANSFGCLVSLFAFAKLRKWYKGI